MALSFFWCTDSILHQSLWAQSAQRNRSSVSTIESKLNLFAVSCVCLAINACPRFRLSEAFDYQHRRRNVYRAKIIYDHYIFIYIINTIDWASYRRRTLFYLTNRWSEIRICLRKLVKYRETYQLFQSFQKRKLEVEGENENQTKFNY